jgi:MFS family permease
MLAPSTSTSTAVPTLGHRLLLVALMLGSATTALVLVVLVPVLPMLAASFGGGAAGAALAQSVMTAPALGLIAGGLISAAAIKGLGAYRLLLLGLALYGLTGSAGLWLSGAPALLGARFLLGISASFVGIAATALIAALYPPEPRARLLGFKGALGSVGGVLGILIGGELGSIGGWRLPFAVYLIGWLLLAFVLAGRRVEVAAPVAAPRQAAAGGLLALWPFYLMIVAFGIVLMMTNTQLSFLLAEIGVRAPSAVGRIAVMASVGAVAGGLSYGAVRRRLSSTLCFALIFAVWTIGLSTLGFARDAQTATIGCLVCGCAAGLFLPHMVTTLAGAAADDVRDRAIAMFYSAVFLGDFLNPLLVEPLSEQLTRHGAFRAVAGFTGAAMVVALLRRFATRG